MSDKLSTCANAVRAALETLVEADGSGLLKAVTAEVLVPAKVSHAPAAGVVISTARREGATWVANLLVTVVASASGAAVGDEVVCGLLAGLDGAIEDLVAAGTAGGLIDRPDWQFWYEAGGGGLARVGLIGQVRIRVEEPLAAA